MDNLSSIEQQVFNNVSAILNPTVLLGNRLQTIINSLTPSVVEGTPVNAVCAKIDLTLTGVVIDGETVTIGSDVYEFLADTAQTKTTPTNIAVDISTHVMRSTGSLTMDTKPTSGDTLTIGTKVYTFVPVGTDNADGEVSVGADLAAAQANIVAAINGTDGISDPHPLVHAGDFNESNVSVITCLVGGTAGDLIATTETFTANSNVFGAATLGAGADCTAANAIVHLLAAITASGTQGVSGIDAEGDVLQLVADLGGIAGNAIVVAETLANGTFTGDATHLAGGVDGTVGTISQLMVDDSYLYICVADNTKADMNWRRISLGAAY